MSKKEKLSKFWNLFIDKISNHTKIYSNRTKNSENWLAGATGLRGTYLNCAVSGKYAKIKLWLYRSTEDNKKIFDFLFSKRIEIENLFGYKLSWNRMDDNKISSIIYKIDIDSYDENNWDEVFDFFIEYFPKFEKAFTPYIPKLKELVNSDDLEDDSIDDEDSEEKSSSKRSKITTIEVIIDNDKIEGEKASEIFMESIKHIINKVGYETFVKNKDSYKNFISETLDGFPKSIKSPNIHKIGNIYITTHSSTNSKKSILEKIFNFYGIEGSVSLKYRDSDDSFDDSDYEEEVEKMNVSINPFGGKENSSAICIVGESGTGKTYRVEETLRKHNHKFIIETLDPTSTGLLTQYSSGKYLTNNIGDHIINAKNDPYNLYTIVLDECHKDGYIDRINAELLQCFSRKRNGGLRFFPTNKSTDNLFETLKEKDGRRVIPDNVGFILITSKPDIIENNDDLKNRVSILNLTKEDRMKEFSIEFLTDFNKENDDTFENND